MTAYQVPAGQDGLTATATAADPAVVTWPFAAVVAAVSVRPTGGPARIGFRGSAAPGANGVSTYPAGQTTTIRVQAEATPITMHVAADANITVEIVGYRSTGVLISESYLAGSGGGGGSAPDATTTTKGLARLLGGTADAPTVPASALTGTLDPARLPPLAIIDYLGAVGSQAQMLALVGQKGDWCVRTDTGKGWVISGSDPTQLSSWTVLPYPAATLAGLTDLNSTGAAVGSLSALRRDESGFALEPFELPTPGEGGVTGEQVAEAVAAHDDDDEAHPALRALIGSGGSGGPGPDIGFVHGLVVNGTGDNTAAIQAAINARRTGYGGGIRLPRGRIRITGRITVWDGMSMWGEGSSDSYAGTALECGSAEAGIDVIGSGGTVAEIEVDGLDVAERPVVVGKGDGRLFSKVEVHNAALDNWTVRDTHQNSVWLKCGGTRGGRYGLLIDEEAGGLHFVGFDATDCGVNALRIAQSRTSQSDYAVPSHISFVHCILERTTSDNPTVDIVRGFLVKFDSCVFNNNIANMTAPLVHLRADSGPAIFEDCMWAGAGAPGMRGLRMESASQGALFGRNWFQGVAFCVDVASGGSLQLAHDPHIPSSGQLATTTTNLDQNVFSSRSATQYLSGRFASSVMLQGAVRGEAGQRFRLHADGSLRWGPGSGYTFGASIGRGSDGRVAVTGGLTIDGIVITPGGGGVRPDVQIFTESGTWTKPEGCTTVTVTLIGGGGGGGSGARQPSGTVTSGGGGGGGGARTSVTVPASAVGAAETVTVGGGGPGGSARTTDNQHGSAGTSGGDSRFGAAPTVAAATGGGGGGGGWTGNGAGGAGGYGLSDGITAALSSPGAVGNPAFPGGLNRNAVGGPGGGSGGGISAAPAAFGGGVGAASVQLGSTGAGTAGATGGPGGDGGPAPVGAGVVGGSGGGGGSSITAAAGAGGAGGRYGAGGGGGGAALNGFASGPGGRGGDGLVIVIAA